MTWILPSSPAPGRREALRKKIDDILSEGADPSDLPVKLD
jgi:hypothetical protein